MNWFKFFNIISWINRILKAILDVIKPSKEKSDRTANNQKQKMVYFVKNVLCGKEDTTSYPAKSSYGFTQILLEIFCSIKKI